VSFCTFSFGHPDAGEGFQESNPQGCSAFLRVDVNGGELSIRGGQFTIQKAWLWTIEVKCLKKATLESH
jgi:hypothetical protein